MMNFYIKIFYLSTLLFTEHYNRQIVKRCLTLIWLLDQAKVKKIHRFDPCLFNLSAPAKVSLLNYYKIIGSVRISDFIHFVYFSLLQLCALHWDGIIYLESQTYRVVFRILVQIYRFPKLR